MGMEDATKFSVSSFQLKSTGTKVFRKGRVRLHSSFASRIESLEKLVIYHYDCTTANA